MMDAGIVHPGMHGLLRYTLSLSDETICGCHLDLGYLHRGTEKLMESKHLYQSIGYASRLDYVGGVCWDHLLCQTFEDLVGALLPVRALHLRLLFVEQHRTLNHLLALGCCVGDLGDMYDILRLFDIRESLLTLTTEWTGSRLHTHVIVPGGMSLDPDCSPTNSHDSLVRWLWESGVCVTEVQDWKETMMSRGAVGMRMLKTLPLRVVWGDARSLGSADDLLSGIMLRAGGVPWDLRVQLAYGAWLDVLDSNLYYATGGTAYDRLLLRCDEMIFSFSAQMSVSSMKQDRWSMGGLGGFAYDGLLCLDSEDMVQMVVSYCTTEGPYEVEGTTIGMNELYKGEGAIYMQQGGVDKGRYHFIGGCVRHLEYFDQMVRNQSLSLSDLMSWLGSIDVVVGEMDK